MIQGLVSDDLEPIIPLIIQTPQQQWITLEAAIDTGFTEFLTFRLADVQVLGLPFLRQQPGQLANGLMHLFDVYSATIEWDGQSMTVPVMVADEGTPIVGMKLMESFDVRIEARAGGSVTLEPLP